LLGTFGIGRWDSVLHWFTATVDLAQKFYLLTSVIHICTIIKRILLWQLKSGWHN